jgi:hypothetical protein
MKLPLDTMTVEEKLQAMEELWDDLCHTPDDIPSPAWHGEVLREREEAVARGDEVPEDWESAKRSMRRSIE